MSIRHPELCRLVEKLAVTHEPPTEADIALLEDYAGPVLGIDVEDQLDGWTVAEVRELTGRDDVWSPRRASEALLASLR